MMITFFPYGDRISRYLLVKRRTYGSKADPLSQRALSQLLRAQRKQCAHSTARSMTQVCVGDKFMLTLITFVFGACIYKCE